MRIVFGLFVAALLASTAFAQPDVREPAGTFISGPVKKLPNDGRPAQQIPFPEIKDWNSLVIRLERGMCLGACPYYSVEIRGDGTVTYKGRSAVAVAGTVVTHIAADKVRALFAQFQSANFFWSLDRYAANATDFPTYTMTLSFDGRGKKIEDYIGQAIGMPPELIALEDAIDETAGTAKWLKIAPDTIPALLATGALKQPGNDAVLASLIEAGATAGQVRALLAAGASPLGATTNGFGGGGTALIAAIQRGDPGLVAIVLKAGNHSRGELHDAMQAAAQAQRPDITAILMAGGAGPTPQEQHDAALLAAAKAGSLVDVETALKQGANPGAGGPDDPHMTALMLAAQANAPDVVARLLKAGAAPNAEDSGGTTALIYSAIFGSNAPDNRIATMKFLLAAHADPNVCDRAGNTALNRSVDSLAAVEYLLDAGAKAKSDCPIGPLHYAKDPQVIDALMQAGADPWALSYGKTEYDAICYSGEDTPDAGCAALNRWIAAHPDWRKQHPRPDGH